MGLKRVLNTQKSHSSPIELFNDIRPRSISALYEHQAKLLHNYTDDGIDQSDVAIQGATGSGKTLVGLLIAEWRRRERAERPLYLCPTRQLVHQITAFAKDQMGLPAEAFVGSKNNFTPSAKSSWRSGKTIGIATYSAIFNVNPFFKSPKFIIVDDAHAADQYIGDFWTVRVNKDNQLHLFQELVSILSEVLSSDEVWRLHNDPRSPLDYLWVQIVPAPFIWERENEIIAVLDQAVAKSDLSYRWSVLKGHLRSCQVYVSSFEIMIRPILPPTSSHAPFNNANQRLYMSATLGRGGELERLSGRKKILRISSPEGWNGHGVGRRFFLFPENSLDENESDELLLKLIDYVGRAFYLTSDEKQAITVREFIELNLEEHELFTAQEIEESKSPFVKEQKAVAVVANRYDGIDFPGDECRLLIIKGRPSGLNLQEKFLTEKLGARVLYAERIRTRIIQAFGRCTRSATDFAMVLVMDQHLLDELLLHENQSTMDIEFQTELQFGEEQSSNTTFSDLLEIAKEFYEQGDSWRQAEEDITNLRDNLNVIDPKGLQELEAAAPKEIKYMDSLWNGDYSIALTEAQSVLESLSGGNELIGYRALWQYLAGCAAMLSARERGSSEDIANTHFRTAKQLGSVRWLEKIDSASTSGDDDRSTSLDVNNIENLEAFLCEQGLVNQGPFTTLTTSIRKGLWQEQYKQFELSHVKLGNLLGYDAARTKSKGAPDAWWISANGLCIVFEDHSDCDAGSVLSVTKARQAASHPNWITANLTELPSEVEIIPVLVTAADSPRSMVLPHLKNVAVWRLDEFRNWVDSALTVIRELRGELSQRGDLAWREKAQARLADVNVTPSALSVYLKSLIPNQSE